MGGKIFKVDSLGKGHSPGGPRYKPAKGSGEYALADELVTWFKEREPSRISFEDRVREMSARLEKAPEDFDSNTFLDALVMQVTERIDHERISTIYNLIDPLLQALYLSGHDRLMLDLSPFPDMTPLSPDSLYLAHNICGTEQRKLRLQLRGDIYHVASSVDHCVIECFGTVYGSAASHAKHSEMIFHRPAAVVGPNAESCVFHVQSKGCLPLDSGAAMPKGCTYHVDQHIAEPYLESYRNKGFFAAGNTLIMRSPEGEWVKVDPDDY